jgi:NADH:quinone reductase (non-electrogenic)
MAWTQRLKTLMIGTDMAETTPTNARPQTNVVIVGGGFAGVRAARTLAPHRELAVTLVSAEPTFSYYPQLYHSATGGSRSESALPLTELLGGLPVKLVQDTITTIDPAARTVASGGATYSYDQLVLALGSVTNYFGIAGLPEFSYDIKSPAGAERFKRHLHRQLIDEHQPDLNYVVVGGGPTGVELSAALGSYLRYITRRHGVGAPKYSIDLVEAAPRLLPRSTEATSAHVTRQLTRLGVNVMVGQTVQAETADALQLAGQSLVTKTVVWTAGIANNPFFKANTAHFTLSKNGHVEVDEHLQAGPNIYVLGDNAVTKYAGMAQTAIHNADFAAADLLRARAGHTRPVYQPASPASVIPVGEHWAVADWGPLHLLGYPGYMLRRAADLIGYADVESWSQAVRIWLADGRREDDCPICQPGTAQSSPQA